MEMLTGMFGAVPLDWFILGGILIGIALDTLKSGMGRAVAIAIALPLAAFLFSLTESAFLLSSASGLLSSMVAKLGLFAVLAGGLYFLVRRMGLDYVDSGHGAPLQALLTGAGTAVIFACVWLQTPVLNDWWSFGGQIQSVFSPTFRFWEILIAYAALASARG